MDPNYQPVHAEADKLHYKLQDVIDDHNSPAAQGFMAQAKEVVEDIESNRAPRDVEARIKGIENQLQQLRSQSTAVLSYEDIDMLYHAYEHLRQELHKLPNY